MATDAGCPVARPEGAGGKVCRLERGSPGHSSEVISPEILKMRAALFCIFTYLDTKTLLRAAEVCKDWKFVARHPAVWTRVLLENARVSSKVRKGVALPGARPFCQRGKAVSASPWWPGWLCHCGHGGHGWALAPVLEVLQVLR